jgi:hypothetical protein
MSAVDCDVSHNVELKLIMACLCAELAPVQPGRVHWYCHPEVGHHHHPLPPGCPAGLPTGPGEGSAQHDTTQPCNTAPEPCQFACPYSCACAVSTTGRCNGLTAAAMPSAWPCFIVTHKHSCAHCLSCCPCLQPVADPALTRINNSKVINAALQYWKPTATAA